MGLTFLAPLFLAGLVAVGVPILVHLTHKERKEPVAFPSLMFLRQVPFREASRQRIRHWPLFLLRIAAFIMFAAAFARPLLERGAGPAGAGAPRDVAILLDRSLSMAHGDRWPRATAAAAAAIEGLRGDDRATLVLFDDRPAAISQPTDDQAALRVQLREARPGAGGTRFGPAIQLARDLLDDPSRRREVVLISDFQRAGWDGRGDIRLPAGAELSRVDVGAGDSANVAVGAPRLSRVRRNGRAEVLVEARLARSGGAAGDVPVTLTVEGRVVQTVRVPLAPGDAAAARFTALAEPAQPLRAVITIPDDALPLDNSAHVVLAPVPRVRVLLVHAEGEASRALYLGDALAVSEEPAYPLTTRAAGAVTAADVAAADVILLHDAPVPGGDAGRRLRERVREGAGLLIALGQRSGSLPRDLADSVAAAGNPADRTGGTGAVLSVANYDHPVFAPFGRPRSGDVASARAYRYRPLQPAPAADVLARWDDGSAAMVARTWGRGRVIVWASDLGNRWNDLPLQPVFVPLVHEIGRWLAGYAAQPPAREVGAAVDLTRLASGETGDLVLDGPGGSRALQRGARHATLEAAGFYVVRPVADRARVLTLLAANPDPAESDLSRLDAEELALAIAPRDDPRTASSDRAVAAPDVLERRQLLWWYLLLAVLLLLGAETVVAARLGRLGGAH